MQFASVNGVTLHYQVISAPDDKPTIVFSNSLGTDFRIWRDVIIHLVGQCSIILYDKRGHGLSDIGEHRTRYSIIGRHLTVRAIFRDLGVCQHL